MTIEDLRQKISEVVHSTAEIIVDLNEFVREQEGKRFRLYDLKGMRVKVLDDYYLQTREFIYDTKRFVAIYIYSEDNKLHLISHYDLGDDDQFTDELVSDLNWEEIWHLIEIVKYQDKWKKDFEEKSQTSVEITFEEMHKHAGSF